MAMFSVKIGFINCSLMVGCHFMASYQSNRLQSKYNFNFYILYYGKIIGIKEILFC